MCFKFNKKNNYNEEELNSPRLEHHYRCIGLYINNKIVGILQYREVCNYIQIDIFQIDKEYAGKGYSHLLIDYLKILAKEYGFNKISVIPTPYSGSDIIHPISYTEDILYEIYKKLGFKKIESGNLFDKYELIINEQLNNNDSVEYGKI